MSRLAKERKLSVETKNKISESLKGELNPFYKKIHTAESIKKIINKKSLSEIYIYNSYRELMVIFPSVTTFCKSIKANNTFVNKIIESGNLFRGEWYISKTPFSAVSSDLILSAIANEESAEFISLTPISRSAHHSSLIRKQEESKKQRECRPLQSSSGVITPANPEASKRVIPFYASYLDCSELIEEIKKNISIKQPIFVYDLKFNLMDKYSGIVEAESKLEIRHEIIKQHALSQKPYSGAKGAYIFSFHRLLV